MQDYSDWFEWLSPEAPASDADISYLQNNTLMALTRSEINQLNQVHWDLIKDSQQNFDASNWHLPIGKFPPSYICFLRWSNGGSFQNGAMQFEPFFTPQEIREYLLNYEFPAYLPNAVPIGFDGGGIFYILDMREPPIQGEYPIFMIGAGALFWEEAVWIADTFETLLKRQDNPLD